MCMVLASLLKTSHLRAGFFKTIFSNSELGDLAHRTFLGLGVLAYERRGFN